MSFQRTLTRFSSRAITPSACVRAGLLRAVARVHPRVLAQLDRPELRELRQVVDEDGGGRDGEEAAEHERSPRPRTRRSRCAPCAHPGAGARGGACAHRRAAIRGRTRARRRGPSGMLGSRQRGRFRGRAHTISLERFRFPPPIVAGARKDAAYTPAVRRRSGQLARLLALALCALVAVACGAKPEPTSGKLDTTYPASVRDGTNQIITVEAPPRLVLVVQGGPQRLLSRLGVRAAVAPADVTAARIERRAPRSRGRRARHHRPGRRAQQRAAARARRARLRDARRPPRGHRARRRRPRRADQPRRGGPGARALAARQREDVARRSGQDRAA